METDRRLQAAKIGDVVRSILIGVLGIVLMAVPESSAALLCRVGGRNRNRRLLRVFRPLESMRFLMALLEGRPSCGEPAEP